MMALLTAPELWIGLGLFVVGGYFLLGGSSGDKKRAARLARVTRRAKSLTSQQVVAQSLRRQQKETGAVGEFLASFASIDKLRARLEVAGMKTAPQKFLTVVLAITVLVSLFLLIMGKPPLLAILCGVIAGLGLPHLVVGRRIKRRKLQFLKLFPEAIDLIVRGLRAGLPVAEAFQNISKEIPPPVGDLFATISQQTALGLPMEKALSEASDRLAMTEFNFFVTTIIMQRETGGNLGEILGNLAEVLRQRQMMKLKIGALSSEARASAMIVGALPFVVFVLLELISPHYLRPLFDDFRGNMSLLSAAGSMFIGGFIMYKMTQLEI